MSWEAWGDPPDPIEGEPCPDCDGEADPDCPTCMGEGEIFPDPDDEPRFDDDAL